MSNIATAYATLAAYDPTGTATNRDIGSADLRVADADLPCRILIPATEGTGEFVAIGNLQKMVWRIRDVNLWAPLEAGTGVQQYSSAMLTYITSYLAKVKADRSPAANCVIAAVEFNMAPIQWGQKQYWGIDTLVTVEEIL